MLIRWFFVLVLLLVLLLDPVATEFINVIFSSTSARTRMTTSLNKADLTDSLNCASDNVLSGIGP